MKMSSGKLPHGKTIEGCRLRQLQKLVLLFIKKIKSNYI